MLNPTTCLSSPFPTNRPPYSLPTNEQPALTNRPPLQLAHPYGLPTLTACPPSRTADPPTRHLPGTFGIITVDRRHVQYKPIHWAATTTSQSPPSTSLGYTR